MGRRYIHINRNNGSCSERQTVTNEHRVTVPTSMNISGLRSRGSLSKGWCTMYGYTTAQL